MRKFSLALALLLTPAAADEANLQVYSPGELSIETLQARYAAQLKRLDALEQAQDEEDPLKSRKLAALPADTAMIFDTMWALICGALVMFMQAGFAFLESGSVRAKNSGLVLLKNVLDVCCGTIMWYILGYGFAYGESDSPNGFVGTLGFAGWGFLTTDADGNGTGTTHFYNWFFQWAFCATSATIVSGGVAERIKFPAYVIYSILMTVVIYPVIVHWTWSGSGWLVSNGYADFAGSGIVHLTGGIAALVGATMLGPRAGRWENPDDFLPHDANLVVLGTFILWFGWYGFNCGSTLTFSSKGDAYIASLVAMNTTLSAAAGGLVVLMLRARTRTYDLCGMCNGFLAGLVGVCAGVDVFDPGWAVVCGILAACAYELGHILVISLKIDDPLDAFAVHGCGGLAGLIMRPLFDRSGVSGTALGWNILGAVMIILWSGGISLIIFFVLRMTGQLKVDIQEEEEGGDLHLSHSPPKAYTES